MANQQGIPTLYRGDSLPGGAAARVGARQRGETFADHYVTDGLMPKVNGALSRDLRQPLPVLVAIHVGFDNASIQQTYAADHSPLISFSTDASAAWHFMDRTAKKAFEPCELENATHFMWRLEGVHATRLAPGHYGLEYSASTKNVDQFRAEYVSRVLRGDEREVVRAVKTQIVHSLVAADNRVHTAELIEPREYLACHGGEVEEALLERAITRAEKWSEWLVFATDSEPGMEGPSYRLCLNEYLKLHMFAKARA